MNQGPIKKLQTQRPCFSCEMCLRMCFHIKRKFQNVWFSETRITVQRSLKAVSLEAL